jgi:hypothetical protein
MAALSAALPSLVSPIDFESKMGVDKQIPIFFIFYGFCR